MSYVREGLARLKAGQLMMEESRHLVQVGGRIDEAEGIARSGLALLRSAMNWLEGTSHFDDAHVALDREGRFTRETFGCVLEQDEQGYWVTCPVALAHVRIGMSIGAIVRAARCSICQQDPQDCDHITGEEYGGQLCVREIVRLDLLEVSFVTRPSDPDARIERQSVSSSDLRTQLGDRWHAGMTVSCDRCLSHCEGLSYPQLGH